MAITRAGTNALGTNGTSIPHQWNHTLVAGSNRIVVVCVGTENANDPGNFTATYGGISMLPTNGIDAQQGTGFANNAVIFWLPETSLPANGSNQVSVTFSGTAGTLEISGVCMQFDGVDYATGISSSDTNNGTSSPIANTISAVAGDLIVSACSAGNSGNTMTWNNSQQEQLDYSDTSSNAGAADLITTGSVTSVNTTVAGTINRLARA